MTEVGIDIDHLLSSTAEGLNGEHIIEVCATVRGIVRSSIAQVIPRTVDGEELRRI